MEIQDWLKIAAKIVGLIADVIDKSKREWGWGEKI